MTQSWTVRAPGHSDWLRNGHSRILLELSREGHLSSCQATARLLNWQNLSHHLRMPENKAHPKTLAWRQGHRPLLNVCIGMPHAGFPWICLDFSFHEPMHFLYVLNKNNNVKRKPTYLNHLHGIQRVPSTASLVDSRAPCHAPAPSAEQNDHTDPAAGGEGLLRGRPGRHFGVSADQRDLLPGGSGNRTLLHPQWTKGPAPWSRGHV